MQGYFSPCIAIQDYSLSYKGLQGLPRPGEDCMNSAHLDIILYSII